MTLAPKPRVIAAHLKPENVIVGVRPEYPDAVIDRRVSTHQALTFQVKVKLVGVFRRRQIFRCFTTESPAVHSVQLDELRGRGGSRRYTKNQSAARVPAESGRSYREVGRVGFLIARLAVFDADSSESRPFRTAFNGGERTHVLPRHAEGFWSFLRLFADAKPEPVSARKTQRTDRWRTNPADHCRHPHRVYFGHGSCHRCRDHGGDLMIPAHADNWHVHVFKLHADSGASATPELEHVVVAGDLVGGPRLRSVTRRSFKFRMRSLLSVCMRR